MTLLFIHYHWTRLDDISVDEMKEDVCHVYLIMNGRYGSH